MKEKTLCILAMAAFLIMIAVSFYMRNFHTPENILKAALKENEISGDNYILCKLYRITGFEWIVIKDEDGNNTSEICNIVGSTPFYDFTLSYDFEQANNTFIFYVDEKRMVHSEAINQSAIEYVVSGWDILYPVKHSTAYLFDLFSPKKYITNSDLWNGR